MAANFKIRFSGKNGSGHLKLSGEFDGSSAHELINYLNNHCHDTAPIPIDTNHLTNVYSFGLEVLFNNIRNADSLHDRLQFTGLHASRFIPEVGNN